MTNYKIDGLKIIKQDLNSDPKYRYIKYSTWFCKIGIATDDMGTQICFNGNFFGSFGFRNIEEAVIYLRNNKEKAIKFFRKCYFKSFKVYFTKWYWGYVYWKIRHFFDPNFYISS